MRQYVEMFLAGLFVGVMIYVMVQTANDINSVDYQKIIYDGIKK